MSDSSIFEFGPDDLPQLFGPGSGGPAIGASGAEYLVGNPWGAGPEGFGSGGLGSGGFGLGDGEYGVGGAAAREQFWQAGRDLGRAQAATQLAFDLPDLPGALANGDRFDPSEGAFERELLDGAFGRLQPSFPALTLDDWSALRLEAKGDAIEVWKQQRLDQDLGWIEQQRAGVGALFEKGGAAAGQLAGDPAALARIGGRLQQLGAVADSVGLFGPGGGRNLVERFQEAVAEATLDRRIATDPDGVRRELEAGKLTGDPTAIGDKLTLAGIKSHQTAARAELSGAAQRDAEASAMAERAIEARDQLERGLLPAALKDLLAWRRRAGDAHPDTWSQLDVLLRAHEYGDGRFASLPPARQAEALRAGEAAGDFAGPEGAPLRAALERMQAVGAQELAAKGVARLYDLGLRPDPGPLRPADPGYWRTLGADLRFGRAYAGATELKLLGGERAAELGMHLASADANAARGTLTAMVDGLGAREAAALAPALSADAPYAATALRLRAGGNAVLSDRVLDAADTARAESGLLAGMARAVDRAALASLLPAASDAAAADAQAISALALTAQDQRQLGLPTDIPDAAILARNLNALGAEVPADAVSAVLIQGKEADAAAAAGSAASDALAGRSSDEMSREGGGGSDTLPDGAGADASPEGQHAEGIVVSDAQEDPVDPTLPILVAQKGKGRGGRPGVGETGQPESPPILRPVPSPGTRKPGDIAPVQLPPPIAPRLGAPSAPHQPAGPLSAGGKAQPGSAAGSSSLTGAERNAAKQAIKEDLDRTWKGRVSDRDLEHATDVLHRQLGPNAKPEERTRALALGQDVASGRFRPREIDGALEYEKQTGRKLERNPGSGGDFVEREGHGGIRRSIDLMGPFEAKYFKVENAVDSFNRHTQKKGVDVIVIDVRGLNLTQITSIEKAVAERGATGEIKIEWTR